MENAQLYYKNSGKVPIAGLALTLLVGGAACLIIAPIYAYATFYIPLAGIVTLLLALGAGFAVGFGVGKLAYIGKIRNGLVTTALGLLFGLNAWYLAWVFWVNIVLSSSDAGSNLLVLLLRPDALIRLILAINAEGVWSISGGTPTGVILWILWAIELGIFVGTAVITAAAIQVAPFCEACGCWCTPPATVAVLGPGDEGALKERLEGRDLSALAELGPLQEGGFQFTNVQLSRCEKCNNLHTLTVLLTTIAYNDKGERKQDDHNVVTDFLLTAEEAAWVAQLGALPPAEPVNPGPAPDQISPAQ